MGPVTRVVQTGIGLVAELKAAREEQRNTSQGDANGDLTSSQYISGLPLEIQGGMTAEQTALIPSVQTSKT